MGRVHQVDKLIEDQAGGSLPLRVLLCSCALMVIEGYDTQVAGYGAPAMIADLGVSKAVFAPVFSLAMFGYMIGAVVLGSLSDRVGRKRVILCGTCLFGVFTLLTAFTRDLTVIMAFRLLAGIGLGAGIPATMALAAEYSPVRTRGRRTTLMYIGYTLGGALSGGVAAQLLGRAGWQSLFVAGGVLPLLLAGVVAILVPESPCFLALRPQRRGEMLRVLRRLRPDIAFDPADRFVLSEAQAATARIRNLFMAGRAPVTLVLWACFILNFAALNFITSWLPTVLHTSGLSLGTAAMVSSTFLAGGSLGGILAGRFLDKGGLRNVAAMVLLSIPFVLGIGFAGTGAVLLATCVGLAGVTMMGGQIGLNATPGLIYPTAIRSTGVGWGLGVGRIGSMVGPAVGGLLLSMQVPTSTVFELASVPLLLCAAGLFVLSRLAGHMPGPGCHTGATRTHGPQPAPALPQAEAAGS